MMMVRRRSRSFASASERLDGFGGSGDRVTKLVCRLHLAVLRVQEQSGATAVEYALMLALIAMVIVGAVAFLGRSTSNAFTSMTFSAP